MTKYQCPSDVEAAMDRFAEDNPGAGWRAIIRAFQRAMLQSMREGELRRTMISEKNAMKRAVCAYCGVKEGQLHLPGCDDERCPFCGHQLNSCDCDAYEKLGIEWAYDHGLTDEQSRELSREWDKLLRAKGRIPFILYPNLCRKCGVLWPEMFSVPDEEWERYIEPRMRGKMLCEACYTQIKEWIDGAAQEAVDKR